MTEERDEVTGVEQEVGAFFREVGEGERAPDDLWERVGARIGAGAISGGGRAAGGRGVRRWLWGAGIAAALVVGAVLVALSWGNGSPSVSAEEVLERAMAASVSPESVGIRTLVVEQEWTIYYLGAERRGEVFAEIDVQSWYATPDRQRIELEIHGAKIGEEVVSGSQVTVWDGDEVWRYMSGDTDQVVVYGQDPDGDIRVQGGGGMVPMISGMLGQGCRTPLLVGEAEVVGRSAYVLELSRSSCGRLLPGNDGKSTVWVERDTGFVLRLENHAVDGTLSLAMEMTSIEINGAIADERFEFETPAGDVERDRRHQTYMAGARSVDPWQPTRLDEVETAATFPIVIPTVLPSGFELELVEQFWLVPSREVSQVRLRYVDAAGNWLVVEEGFDGLYALFASVVPPWGSEGTVEVNGRVRTWTGGDPLRGYEVGTMLMLGWSLDEDGSVMPGGLVGPQGPNAERPRAVVLATNVLSLEELVAVAESLE